jgi:hypothetical protein
MRKPVADPARCRAGFSGPAWSVVKFGPVEAASRGCIGQLEVDASHAVVLSQPKWSRT